MINLDENKTTTLYLKYKFSGGILGLGIICALFALEEIFLDPNDVKYAQIYTLMIVGAIPGIGMLGWSFYLLIQHFRKRL